MGRRYRSCEERYAGNQDEIADCHKRKEEAKKIAYDFVTNFILPMIVGCLIGFMFYNLDSILESIGGINMHIPPTTRKELIGYLLGVSLCIIISIICFSYIGNELESWGISFWSFIILFFIIFIYNYIKLQTIKTKKMVLSHFKTPLQNNVKPILTKWQSNPQVP